LEDFASNVVLREGSVGLLAIRFVRRELKTEDKQRQEEGNQHAYDND
jgi:hypothetical protein